MPALTQAAQVLPVELPGIALASRRLQKGPKALHHQPFPPHLPPVEPIPEALVDLMVQRHIRRTAGQAVGAEQSRQRLPLGAVKIKQCIVGVEEDDIISGHIGSFPV